MVVVPDIERAERHVWHPKANEVEVHSDGCVVPIIEYMQRYPPPVAEPGVASRAHAPPLPNTHTHKSKNLETLVFAGPLQSACISCVTYWMKFQLRWRMLALLVSKLLHNAIFAKAGSNKQ